MQKKELRTAKMTAKRLSKEKRNFYENTTVITEPKNNNRKKKLNPR